MNTLNHIKKPSLKDKFINLMSYLWTKMRINSLLWIVYVFCIASALTYVGGGVYTSLQDHRQSSVYMNIPVGTIKEASEWMEANNIKSITKNVVYKNPSWMNMKLITIQVFEPIKGQPIRIDDNVLPEEFRKNIAESGSKNAFTMSIGDIFPKDNTLLKASRVMFLYSAFITVILFALLMVGQVISGRTFIADVRDKKLN